MDLSAAISNLQAIAGAIRSNYPWGLDATDLVAIETVLNELKAAKLSEANAKIQLREVCLIATGLAYSVRVSWDVEEREKNLAAWEKFVLESKEQS